MNLDTSRTGQENNQRYTMDVLERVVWTFIQAFAATYAASGLDVGGVNDMDVKQKLAIAALAGAAALIKCLVAKSVGSPNTAATLPVEDDTSRP